MQTGSWRSHRWSDRSRWGAVVLVLSLAACARRPAASQSAPGRRPLFEMNGHVMSFDGTRLRFGDRFETWIAALGPPTRTSHEGGVAHWDKLDVEIGGPTTADGARSVSMMRVGVGRGFPGTFRLQGVNVAGRRALSQVQAELPPGHPLVSRGGRSLPEDAIMRVAAPDGFEVSVLASLDCDAKGEAPSPRAPDRPCTQVIELLEISASR